MEEPAFGCGRCIPEEPRRPFDLPLERIVRLVEESHFMLDVLRCPECAQRFVLVYMERIDWTGGEDATTHNLMPLTAPEAALMLAAGEDVDVAEIQRIGRARRYLCDEWPTGRERIVEYEVGWVVPPHD